MKFLYVFLLLMVSLLGADTLKVQSQSGSFTEFNLQMYEDSSARLTFDEIQNINAFSPHTNNISTGYSNSTFWFKFTMQNVSNTKLRYFVRFSESNMHKANFYTTSNMRENTFEKYGVSYYKKGVKNGVVEIFHWKHGHLVRREHWVNGKEQGTGSSSIKTLGA